MPLEPRQVGARFQIQKKKVNETNASLLIKKYLRENLNKNATNKIIDAITTAILNQLGPIPDENVGSRLRTWLEINLDLSTLKEFLSKKKDQQINENQKRPIWPIPDELLLQASEDLSDLEFVIFKLAREQGLNNHEISATIGADPDLSKKYPRNTPESVRAIINKKFVGRDNPYQIPRLMTGRHPDENLLQAFLLKAKEKTTQSIIDLLYSPVSNIKKKISSIDANYSQKRKKAFNLFSKGYDNSTIIKQIFPQLIINRDDKLKDATQLIEFWREQHKEKVVARSTQ